MIQVLHRAFDIIELVSRDPNKSYVLSEIADELGLNHGTCANIIKTMVSRNYLEQIGPKKGYKLGIMAYQIVGNNSYEDKLRKVSSDIIERLTATLNETSLLAILKKSYRVIVCQAQAERDLMVRSTVEKEAYNSASGRLLVASLNDKDLSDFIARYGLPDSQVWDGASTEGRLRQEIESIRENGFARQITASQILGLAVPVKRNEEVVAALSVYLPMSRLTPTSEQGIFDELKRSALEITLKLSQ